MGVPRLRGTLGQKVKVAPFSWPRHMRLVVSPVPRRLILPPTVYGLISYIWMRWLTQMQPNLKTSFLHWLEFEPTTSGMTVLHANNWPTAHASAWCRGFKRRNPAITYMGPLHVVKVHTSLGFERVLSFKDSDLGLCISTHIVENTGLASVHWMNEHHIKTILCELLY